MKRKLTPEPNTKESARRTREHLVAGRIVRPHGVRGQVVIEPTSELIERLRPGQALRLTGSGRTTRLVSLQPHQTRYVATLEGIADRAAAEALRGETIECPIEAIGPLPDGVYFRWEIIGLRAVTDDGTELGEIVDVFSTGANDVYEVLRADGSRVLLPAISSVVLGIDLERGQARIHLLPGLIDPA